MNQIEGVWTENNQTETTLDSEYTEKEKNKSIERDAFKVAIISKGTYKFIMFIYDSLNYSDFEYGGILGTMEMNLNPNVYTFTELNQYDSYKGKRHQYDLRYEDGELRGISIRNYDFNGITVKNEMELLYIKE